VGNEGIGYFGVLIGLAIPIINLFAVCLLIWFSGEELSGARRLRITIKEIISNPLILACVAGILYGQLDLGFPRFLDNTFALVSMVALPLALLSIGGSLTLKGVRENLRLSLLAAGLKLLALPAIGYLLYRYSGVDPLAMRVGMIFFALPTSTAIYVLSSQLGSDTELASASIVVSTVLSFLSLSVALLL
jgi:predicted permease